MLCLVYKQFYSGEYNKYEYTKYNNLSNVMFQVENCRQLVSHDITEQGKGILYYYTNRITMSIVNIRNFHFNDTVSDDEQKLIFSASLFTSFCSLPRVHM